MNHFTNQVAALRIQKGMTQKELADACNIDIRTIQRIEAGEVVPRMYTIKLLAKALDCDAGLFTPVAALEKSRPINNQLGRPFWASVVFSINAIPVVYDLTGHPLNAFFHISFMLVHAISSLFFLYGFYLLGKQFNNGIMAITSLLAMILMPMVTIMNLLPGYYNGFVTFILYLVLCTNELAGGAGFLIEGHKRKNRYSVNYYTLAGIMIILQTVLFLGMGTRIAAIGLMISLLSNIITTIILYVEYHNGKDFFAKANPAGFQHKTI